ncbi:hypothetical protein FACS189450_02190 [Spirochaetia bacterium]|nr:hypothetical protein FACS189450_02190 [Spirochaetia bacterium]
MSENFTLIRCEGYIPRPLGRLNQTEGLRVCTPSQTTLQEQHTPLLAAGLLIADSLGKNANLGDLLYESRDSGLTGERIALLLRAILVDKRGYRAVSTNLGSVTADLSRLAEEFARWKGVDLVAAYHHSELGLLAANPKNSSQLACFGSLQKRELLVIYAGKGSKAADESCLKAAKLAVALFEGGTVSGQWSAVPAVLLRGNFTVKKMKKTAAEGDKTRKVKIAAPVKARRNLSRTVRGPKKAIALAVKTAPRAAVPAIAKAPLRMTPRYSVIVTNELFHNGNVEAWKRIITSYKARYPELQVYIYYEGERILDINSLFVWGKVKHGVSIQFAVAGNGIADVAKLQRYLAQGASNQFEVFLRNAADTVLRLFG